MSKEKKLKLVRFALLSALFVWAALAYGQLGIYMQKGILFARVLDGRPYVSDFVNFYSNSLLSAKCLQGEKIKIYDRAVQNESVKKLIAPVVPEQPFYFQYPPYVFLLILPLSVLSMPVAWFCWNVVGVALSVFSLLKLEKIMQPDEPQGMSEGSSSPGNRHRTVLLFIALTFASFPAWLSLELGQASFYVLGALAFMLYFLKGKKYFLSGIASGFITIKLQYFPFFWIIGLVHGKWRFLAGALSCLAVLLLLSFFVLGADNVLSYPQALFSGETGQAVSGVSSFMMQNWRGQLFLLLKGENAGTLKFVLAAFLLSIIAVLYLNLKKYRDAGKRSVDVVAALSIMIALMGSVHTHTQDYFLLAVAALLLRDWLSDRSTDANISSAAIGQGKIIRRSLLLFPALSWLFFYLQPLLMLLAIQPFFIYLLLLSILILWRLERSNVRTSP